MSDELAFPIGTMLAFGSGEEKYLYLGIFGSNDGDGYHAVRDTDNNRVYATAFIKNYRRSTFKVGKYYEIEQRDGVFKILDRFIDEAKEYFAAIQVGVGDAQRTFVAALRPGEFVHAKEVGNA